MDRWALGHSGAVVVRNVSTTLIQPRLAFRLHSMTPAGGLWAMRIGRHGVFPPRPRTVVVKVFGCRQASENRPSTNPRGCGDGLWGFRVLRGLGGCAAGSVRALAAARGGGL